MDKYQLTLKQSKEFSNHNKIRVETIQVGMKIKVKEGVLSELKNNEYIQDNFKLNVKRLNRWWYSVYFKEKCSHQYEPLIIDGIKFCSKCKEKLE
jgi:hypothetical protein